VTLPQKGFSAEEGFCARARTAIDPAKTRKASSLLSRKRCSSRFTSIIFSDEPQARGDSSAVDFFNAEWPPKCSFHLFDEISFFAAKNRGVSSRAKLHYWAPMRAAGVLLLSN
jgi:hypothetical protein